MNRPLPEGEQYVITVEGLLSPEWVDWPCQVRTQHGVAGAAQRSVTVLTVNVPDQPALHGLLEKIRDLNLKLISVERADLAA
jgi:hypothetical protein